MCLFLQTQQFQQITAALVTDMHASSTAANASLAHIRSDLLAQAQSLAQSLSALNRLQAVQSEVESAVQAGLVEVRGLSQMSQGLQQSMDQSINMTVSKCAAAVLLSKGLVRHSWHRYSTGAWYKAGSIRSCMLLPYQMHCRFGRFNLKFRPLQANLPYMGPGQTGGSTTGPCPCCRTIQQRMLLLGLCPAECAEQPS